MTQSPERALSVAPSSAFWLAIGLYAIATVLWLLVTGKRAALRPFALGCVVLAFVAHGCDIGYRGFNSVHPAQSVREAIGFLSFMVTGGFLLASLRFRLTFGGVLVMPIAMLLLLAARLTPAGPSDRADLSTIGRVHISLATIGVAIFALATVLSALYVIEERKLKKKRFDTMSFRDAPLEGLDRLAHRLIWIGFPIFTAAIALGTVWISKLGEGWSRPEYGFAMVTWVAFAAVLIMRTAYGWRGRRSAKLTMVGFAAALVVLAVYLIRRVVG